MSKNENTLFDEENKKLARNLISKNDEELKEIKNILQMQQKVNKMKITFIRKFNSKVGN